MATTSQIVDEYVVETRVVDNSSAGVNAATKALADMEKQAAKTAEGVSGVGGATNSTGETVKTAATTFERFASRADDVTRAHNGLVKAQQTLVQAQNAANREVAAGKADQDQINRTLAEYAERVKTAAEKLGNARVEAEANAQATAAWNTQLGQGQAAMATYAANIAKATEASREAEKTAIRAAGSQEELNRILGAGATGAGFAGAMERARASVDEVYAASKRYEAQLSKIDDLEIITAISADVATAARKRATDAFAQSASVIEASVTNIGAELDQLQAKYDKQFAYQQRYAEAQAATNRLVGEGRIDRTKQTEIMGEVVQTSPEVIRSNAIMKQQKEEIAKADREAALAAKALAAENERLRLTYDANYAAGQKYAATMKDISAALKLGYLDSNQAISKSQEAMAQREKDVQSFIGNAAKTKDASNANGYASRFMGIQFVQAFSGIATGQPIMLTLIQQGHQVIDVMLAMNQSVGDVAKSIGNMFRAILTNPFFLLGASITAVAGTLYALIASGNASLAKMAEIRGDLRLTQTNYAALAETVDQVSRKVAASTALTSSEAQKLVTAFAANKAFGGTAADLERLSRLALDLGRVLGGDATEGQKLLTAAMQDTSKVAHELADRGFEDVKEKLAKIDDLQARNDKSGAFTTLLDALGRIRGSADDLSPISKAWIELGNAFSNGTQGWRPFKEFLANDFANFLKQLAVVVRDLGDAWNYVGDKIKSVGSAAATSLATMPLDDYGRAIPSGSAATTSGGSSSAATSSSGGKPVPEGYRELLDGVADLVGLEREALRRVQASEGVYKNGRWEVSSSGAVGGMQLLPGTFADMQKKYSIPGNINDDRANAMAGGYYLKENIQLAAGDLYRGTLGYHDGPGTISGRGMRAPSGPAEKQAREVTAGYTGTPLTDPSKIIDDSRVMAEEIRKSTEAAREFKGVQLEAELVGIYQKQIQVAESSGVDSDAFKALEQDASKVRAAIYANVSAQDAAQRSTESQTRADIGLTAAEQGLNAELERRRELGKSTGEGFTSAQASQATAEYIAKQTNAYDRLRFSLSQTTANSFEMTEAYAKGDQAVINATAKQLAYTQAINLFPPGSQAAAEAFKRLIPYYEKLALEASKAQVAQQNAGLRDGLKYIEAETQSITMNENARALLLATMKAEQAMHVKFGDIASKEAQDYIALTAATVQAQQARDSMKRSFDEVGQFVDKTFTTISDAIVQSFATGEKSATSFADVSKAVISSLKAELFKLAVINPLKNFLLGKDDPTLGSVYSSLAKRVEGLFGDSSTTGGSGISEVLAVAGGATATINAFDGSGQSGSLDANGDPVLTPATSAATAAVGGISATSVLKVAYDLGKLVFGQIGTGASIAASLFPAAATNLALSALPAGVSGVATAAEVASVSGVATVVAAVGEAAGLSAVAATALASTVASALPAVGAAVAVATNLITGNYRGAALVAGGALLGAAVAGPLGAAIGAVVGQLVDMFLPNHPKNPYQSVALNAEGGRLARGAVVSQLEDPGPARDAVDTFAASINTYMESVGIRLANADGRLGGVGRGIKGFEQVENPADLFKALRFTALEGDNSTFGIAKRGALPGMEFAKVEDLQNTLVKIASFADGIDILGLQLESVGNDLTNIKVSGLKESIKRVLADAQIEADGSTSIGSQTAGFGTPIYVDAILTDLQKALQAGLSGITFPNLDAFVAEVTKINNFVNGTIPSLLNPQFEVVSDLQKQIQATVVVYANAIDQAQKYGLATDKLTDAQGKAIAILQIPALKELEKTNISIAQRGAVARGQNTQALQLQTFDVSAAQQRVQLADAFKNIYGSLIPPAKEYAAALLVLDQTLSDERIALEKQTAREIIAAARSAQDAELSVMSAFFSIRARQAALSGQNELSEIHNYNIRAIEETKNYDRQLADFYGDSFRTTQDYHNRMSELETVQQGERLAISKKYADQLVAEQKTAADDAARIAKEALDRRGQAQDAVRAVVTNLRDYARTLSTSAASPLSPQDQLRISRNQFNAVQGAAQAGDFNSLAKLREYSETFLTASREVNGSGTQYFEDYKTVLSALENVASTDADTLTASYQQQIAQSQTDQLLTELRLLRSEVAGLRLETQQSGKTPARIAA